MTLQYCQYFAFHNWVLICRRYIDKNVCGKKSFQQGYELNKINCSKKHKYISLTYNFEFRLSSDPKK